MIVYYTVSDSLINIDIINFASNLLKIFQHAKISISASRNSLKIGNHYKYIIVHY